MITRPKYTSGNSPPVSPHLFSRFCAECDLFRAGLRLPVPIAYPEQVKFEIAETTARESVHGHRNCRCARGVERDTAEHIRLQFPAIPGGVRLRNGSLRWRRSRASRDQARTRSDHASTARAGRAARLTPWQPFRGN